MSDGPIIDIEKIKRGRLADIISRALANPEELQEVVQAISADWFPLMRIDRNAKVQIIVGGDKKR